MHIRIGTRGSQLALWQAEDVASRLQNQGCTTEIITISTKGDEMLDVALSKIGSKGVFTEEIEAQLANGSIDVAVHSAKDLQSTLPDEFDILAFLPREKVNDVLISHQKNISLDQKKITVGTSSTRRVATLKMLYPHVQTVPVRGNLQTRIRKMKEGACDALMLAYAGVHRMGYKDMIVQELPHDVFIPAVGQGAIAVEVHDRLDDNMSGFLHNRLSHPNTSICIRAERMFLAHMEGGCSVPVFAYATLVNQHMQITGGVISLDGKAKVIKSVEGHMLNSEELGEELSKEVLNSGGKEILEAIKKELNDE